jgi:hypothetical protein
MLGYAVSFLRNIFPTHKAHNYLGKVTTFHTLNSAQKALPPKFG